MKENCLDERTRAEDILLGALGYGEDAHIVAIKETDDGFSGFGKFSDGEEFEFKSDYDLSDIDKWALSVIIKSI